MPKTEKPTKQADVELLTISRIQRHLEKLDTTGRSRVLAYLLARHGAEGTVKLPANAGAPTLPGLDGSHV